MSRPAESPGGFAKTDPAHADPEHGYPEPGPPVFPVFPVAPDPLAPSGT